MVAEGKSSSRLSVHPGLALILRFSSERGPPVPSLFESLPQSLPEELVEVLVRREGCRVERIVSMGHASPPGFWYDQAEDEFVLLVRGSARLEIEGELVELRPGDFRLIPAHQRHRVDWTTAEEATVWLAVFCAAGR